MREIRVTKYYTNSDNIEFYAFQAVGPDGIYGMDWTSTQGSLGQGKEAFKMLCKELRPEAEFKPLKPLKPLKPRTGEEIFFLDWD